MLISDAPRQAGPDAPLVEPTVVHGGALPGSGRGRKHGTSKTEPFDRWFRYPAGFASDYVTSLLAHLELPKGSTVIDPFAGSAVTGTAARRAGHSFYGVEAHPSIAELGQLKLNSAPQHSRPLSETAKDLVIAAESLAVSSTSRLNQESDLVRRCFTEPVLTRLASLRDLIKAGAAEEWHLYAKWALLGTLRDVSSARVGWPYQRPGSERKPTHADPMIRFLQRVSWMEEDLKQACEFASDLNFKVVNGDSRSQISWAEIDAGGAQGCVSSPPYLNNFDYADATRLELYFWGDVSSWAEMCASVRAEMLTATTQQSSVGAALSARSKLSNYGTVFKSIEEIVEKLTAERAARRRGKEYDRVIPDYFLAIAQVLEQLAMTMKPGAPAIWLVGDSAPYGVYIDTPRIISDLAQELGFSSEKDVVLRRRGQRWASNTTRHDVELSERMIVFRRVL
ncbi:DNA methyltransferase [Streptomyces sp. NPDC059814]|uniref:DNA methyltransferase n=1 Tax=Streptomyces sp. NPDC059814 TaxID=3346959 RepID=UPI00365DCD87